MRGRFAPSPTGPLHFGSLVTAVASYVDAKSAGGEWIVRIEDVDTARTVPGAGDVILRSLEAHGLWWDDRSIMIQSGRTEAYQEAFARLGGLVYPCGCSRKDVGGVYPGTCRGGLAGGREARAWRLRVPEDRVVEFTDRRVGCVRELLPETCGDFIVRRADGVFAYQLAVVVDDAEQGITDVVRGADLLESTARQVYLYEALGLGGAPRYLHVPVVTDVRGEKLSKQTNAPALDDSRAGESLWNALAFLKQAPPVELRGASPRELLEWALGNWNPLVI